LAVRKAKENSQNMKNTNRDETTYYRYCRTLEGKLEPVDYVRHNGRLVPRFVPDADDPPAKDRSDLKRLLREVMYGLNRTERRTWLLLLLGNSILEVACKEKVSRTAIYERIRGNAHGHGGMIRKNDYVWIWWRDQRKKNK
jgi:hypothetical protein